MGNQLTQPARQAESLADLPGVTFKDSLGGGRFFKSALCVHDEGGLVVVKTYVKRPDSPDLRPYEEQLLRIRGALSGLAYPHAWPAQRVYQSDRAVHLMRQYLFANLGHRVSTRPFLSAAEKKWIAYQLLLALVQCHERGVCHGDVKPENVLVTSWGWAYLTDFAPYKPVALPADNPAQFSFFFDTSGRRRAYLAPERFQDPPAPAGGGNGNGSAAAAAGAGGVQQTPAELTPAMDVFSLGCVLAELFLEGQPLFDYSRLLAYRQGAHDPGPALARLEPGVRDLVAHMIQRDPARRLSAAQYLQEMGAAAFPSCLPKVIHPFLASMLHLDTDAMVALVREEYPHIKARLLGQASQAPAAGEAGAAQQQQQRAAAAAAAAAPAQQQQLGRQGGQQGGGAEARQAEVGALLGEAQSVLHQLEGRSRPGSQASTPQHTPRGGVQGEPPAAGATPSPPLAAGPPAGEGTPQAAAPAEAAAAAAGGSPGTASESPPGAEGMVLVAALLCTLLRGSRLQEHKARVVALLCDSAAHCDEDTRLQRALPYLLAATAEPLAAVKCAALRGITGLLAQVRWVPPSDAKVFAEYVLPSLSLLPTEGEASVQVEYAACIAPLAATAQAFLEQLQRRRQQQGASPSDQAAPLSYDEEVVHLRTAVEQVAHELLVGPRAEAKLALLPHLHRLAAFVGRRDTADVLLPSLLTFFNSQSWQVRAAFYASLTGICPSLGPEGVAAVVLPFLDRMVGDPEPAVVAEAVVFLTSACRGGLLRKRHLLAVASKVCGRELLEAGSTAVRAAAVEFVAAAAEQLSGADVQAQLLPIVLPHLTGEPLSLQDAAELTRLLRDGGLPRPPGAGQQQPHHHHQQQQQQATGSGRPPAGMQPVAPHAMRPPVAASGARSSSSRGLVVPPAATASYSLQVDGRFLHPGCSYLGAALEQSVVAQPQGGHLIAPTTPSGPSGSGGGASRLHFSAHVGAADAGAQLVARARRNLPQAAGIPSSMRASLGQAGVVATDALGRPVAVAGGLAGAAGAPGAAPPLGPPGNGVRDAMNAAIASGIPDASDTLAHTPPWYPRGVLVAHLAEHRKAVNRLAAAANGAFFVSASSDETVKVWDCRRLEKDVSFRSRLTYSAQGGRITAVAACQDSQSVASGSADGSIHVWRVEYTCRSGGAPDRYTGIVGSRQVATPRGAVLDLASWGPSLLVYSTQQGGLASWDLRLGADAWTLPCPPSQGLVERFACDPGGQNWLVSGTARGHLTLWDARFMLPVNTWQHPAAAPVTSLALAEAPLARLGLQPGAAVGPLLYVAAGEAEVGLWDVAEGKCHQVLRALRQDAPDAARRQVPFALASPSPLLAPRGGDLMSRARQLGVGELQAPPARRDAITALLPTSGGPLISAGADRTIRCWDSGRPQQSYVVCTPPPPIPPPQQLAPAPVAPAAAGGAAALGDGSQVEVVDVPQYAYRLRSVQGVPVVEESCALARSVGGPVAGDKEQLLLKLGWVERAAAACHQQAVLDLLRVEASEPLLLSASRDGVVKCWR